MPLRRGKKIEMCESNWGRKESKMHKDRVPSQYSEMDLSRAREFDQKVKKNFMPAIRSTVRQIVEDYGPLQGTAVDVGCGTAVFAIELCRQSDLKIYALEKVKAIYEVARMNIEKEGLRERVIPVLGDASEIPLEDGFADFVISRGAYHCWEDKPKVLREIYRVLKRGGIALVGGGFGRYVSDEDLERMKELRDRSLGEAARVYSSPRTFQESLEEAGIRDFRLIRERAGLWAEIRK